MTLERVETLLKFSLSRKDLTYLRAWRNDAGTLSSTLAQDHSLKSEAAAYNFFRVTRLRRDIDWDTYTPATESRPSSFLRKAKHA